MGANIAIVGAGYVGMPLARVFADAGKSVVLVDVNQEVVDGINRGESHIGDVPSEDLKALVDAGHVSATSDYDVLKEVDGPMLVHGLQHWDGRKLSFIPSGTRQPSVERLAARYEQFLAYRP